MSEHGGDECVVSEAFMEEVRGLDEDEQSVVVVDELGPSAAASSDSAGGADAGAGGGDGDGDGGGGALRATLGVASSAASLVLFPYVAAGKVAIQATSYAVAAPITLTNHMKASIAESWSGTASREEEEEEVADLFGERGDAAARSRTSTNTTSDLSSELENEQVMDLFAEDSEDEDDQQRGNESGGVKQLLFLPVRLVHSGMSTAVAIPRNVASYSGRKIHGAVSTSSALATSAMVASTGVVAKTSLHVARGLTHGAISTAAFTAQTVSGAMEASVRTASYVIPTPVSNAVWKTVDVTGNASANVLSYAIAIPSYRMLHALVPSVERYFSEQDCVDETRACVKLLVRVLGPQNALHVLKCIYETINSDEAHDAFLLCHDLVREAFDGQNYRRAGSSVGKATGITTVAHVVKEAYSVLPSFEELLDAAALVADVSDEVIDGVAHVVSRGSDGEDEVDSNSRFEYLGSGSEMEDSEKEDGEVDDGSPVQLIAIDETFEREESESTTSEEEVNPLLESGISLLTRVCDSEEATSLFNTFGDFLDVLVD